MWTILTETIHLFLVGSIRKSCRRQKNWPVPPKSKLVLSTFLYAILSIRYTNLGHIYKAIWKIVTNIYVAAANKKITCSNTAPRISNHFNKVLKQSPGRREHSIEDTSLNIQLYVKGNSCFTPHSKQHSSLGIRITVNTEAKQRCRW